jgi:hypothetical protein
LLQWLGYRRIIDLFVNATRMGWFQLSQQLDGHMGWRCGFIGVPAK